ncbi:hypothetical protein H5410_014279 [Solanum commersonii]|uniref:Uncharacterized protein n=1 Tax=Solanum commersonii TaxID=4109 RepID=A0A9J5ZQZ0_SOLCO|nr:hypothetical protein H5410_014279 [Solanum commersonii]
MKILTARLALEDRFWSRTTLRSLPEALDDICGIWLKRYGCGTHFSSKQSPNGNSAFTAESEISFQLDSIYENFVGNLAVISETREEASFEVRFESFLRLTCRVFRKDRRGIICLG